MPGRVAGLVLVLAMLTSAIAVEAARYRPGKKHREEETKAGTLTADALDRLLDEKLGPTGGVTATAASPVTTLPAALWLRRVHLDIAGTLPTADEIEGLGDAPSDEDRRRAVGRLFEAKGYGERWGRLLGKPMLSFLREHEVYRKRLEDYFVQAMQSHSSWRSIARGLLTAEGSQEEAPAISFYLQFTDARAEIAARVGSGLMGVRMACAQCHDHPFTRWTMTDYYGLTAFFGNTDTVGMPRDVYRAYRDARKGLPAEVEIVLPPGKEREARLKRLERVKSTLAQLDQREIAGTSPRRGGSVQMASLGAGAAAPAPAKSAAKAAPSMMMGGGTMKGDDDEDDDKPKAPKMVDLEELTYLVMDQGGGGFTVPDEVAGANLPGKLTRSLAPGTHVPTRFPGGGGPDDHGARRGTLAAWLTKDGNPWFARALVNRVWAELFGHGLVEPVDGLDGPIEPGPSAVLDALAGHVTATGFDVRALIKLLVTTRAYQGMAARGRGVAGRFAVRPLDARQAAGALAAMLGGKGAGDIGETLARAFETKPGDESAEGAPERPVSDLRRALFLVGGPALSQGAAGSPLIARVAKLPDDERLDQLFLALLARPATGDERAQLAARVAGAAPAEALADVAWAICASAEFLTNH